MQLRDILKAKGSQVETIQPAATLRQVAQVACELRIGSLVVVDQAGQLIGIITERDILRQCAVGRNLDEVSVKEAMTSDPIIGVLDDDIQRTMNTMTSQRIRHLPVLDGDRIAGLISIGDLVNALREEEEVEIRYLRDYIGQA